MTRFAEEYPCPRGTWSDSVGLFNESQCHPCPAQYYCRDQGLTSPSDLCSPGFYCVKGARTPTPTEGSEVGNECLKGFYCTEVPVECPIGTFSFDVRLINWSECTPCLSGHFCDSKAATSTSGLCVEGYHCVEGSNSNTSLPCPTGYYCPEGIPDPLPCPVGTYSSVSI